MSRARTFTPEQQEVINCFGEGLAVIAGAGSGKTTTLVEKCRKLLERRPEAKIAAISFTEKSALDLKSKMMESLGGDRVDWVTTIHGFCGGLLKEFPQEVGMEGEESVLNEAESLQLWNQVLEVLWTEDLSAELISAFEALLERESRQGLIALLARVRELRAFGVLDRLQEIRTADATALFVVGRFVCDRYDLLKKRRGKIDFSDLERFAVAMVQNPEIQKILHRRYDLILVDEFQDTNALQAELIRKMSRPDFSNLCVVGDPKQSIYRFRDADVSVFEEFCEDLPRLCTLTGNFRSLPNLLAYTNQLCSQLFAASEMRYDALQALRAPMRAPLGAMTSDSQKQGEPEFHGEVVELRISAPEDLARFLVGERDGPHAHFLKDTALLLRKIRGNEKWLQAIEAAGIPFFVGSGGLFWENPTIRECVALLRFWADPGNRLSGATFLRAPWIGVSDLALDRWLTGEGTQGDGLSLMEQFLNSAHFLSAPLRVLWERKWTVRPGELLLCLLEFQEIEAECGREILGLWHRVEELSRSGLSFYEVAREVSLALEEGRREREVPLPNSEENRLTVLTLHGAKGLEFSQVILVDFDDKAYAPDMPLLYWDRKLGAFLGPRTRGGDRDLSDPGEKRWRELERRKSRDESKRLFYVALTRAKNRLILACKDANVWKDSDKVSDGTIGNLLQVDFWRAWVDAVRPPTLLTPHSLGTVELQPGHQNQAILSRVASFDSLRAYPTYLGKALPKRPRHSVTEWALLARCERAYEWKFIRKRPGREGPEDQAQQDVAEELGVESSMAGGDGAEKGRSGAPEDWTELGTLIHQALSYCSYSRERGVAALQALRGNSLLDRTEFDLEPLIQWVESSGWMGEGGTATRRAWSELAFELPIDREVLVGSVDRVVMEQPNFATVLDFKVSPFFRTARKLSEAYRIQLLLYAYALKRLDESIQNVELKIANITPKGVQVVGVTADQIDVTVKRLSERAKQIVEGDSGVPNPGGQCRQCEWRKACDAAAGLEVGTGREDEALGNRQSPDP